jgi:hypothetical protein
LPLAITFTCIGKDSSDIILTCSTGASLRLTDFFIILTGWVGGGSGGGGCGIAGLLPDEQETTKKLSKIKFINENLVSVRKSMLF